VGLESIREHAPGAAIALLENSVAPPDAEAELRGRVDWYVSFVEDPEAVRLRDSPHKGAAEAYMLLRTVEALRAVNYSLLLKISGRYALSQRFDVDTFPRSGFGFRLSGGVPSTRLYSVAKDSERIYVRQLRRALGPTRVGHGLERVLLTGVAAKRLHAMEAIGLTGLVAVSGDLIDE
jgi:hypothetical protein